MGRAHTKAVRPFTDDDARALLARKRLDPIGRAVKTPRGARYQVVTPSGSMTWVEVLATTSGRPKLGDSEGKINPRRNPHAPSKAVAKAFGSAAAKAISSALKGSAVTVESTETGHPSTGQWDAYYSARIVVTPPVGNPFPVRLFARVADASKDGPAGVAGLIEIGAEKVTRHQAVRGSADVKAWAKVAVKDAAPNLEAFVQHEAFHARRNPRRRQCR